MEKTKEHQSAWLKQFLNSPHIGILIIDKNRKNLFANTYLCKLFGYTEEELVGQSAEILHLNKKAFETFETQAFRFVMQGEPVSIEYRCRHKNGTAFWVHISGDLIRNKDEILWTIVDISDRIKVQQEVVHLKERMELAIEGNRDVVWDWNLSTNALFVTPQWKDIVGYDSRDVPYEMKMWRKYLHPEDLRNVLEDINNTISGKTTYLDNIHRIRHKDGHWIWIHLRGKVQYDNKGNAVRMTGTHRDITKERELQLELVKQAQIIEQIYDSVISTDLSGNIISWNNGSKILFGYSKEEVTDKHISLLYQEKDHELIHRNISNLIENGELCTEIVLRKKSNETVIVNHSLSLFRDDFGNPIGIIYYSQNITERKKVEKALLKQKDLLHYQATHDTLTHLPNRLLFNNTLKASIATAQKEYSKLALLFMDLDYFKKINDSLGHDIGDEVLKAVAQRLKKVVNNNGILSRLGGDEFTIISKTITEKKDLQYFSSQLIHALSLPLEIDGHTLYLSVSIGIGIYPDNGNSAKALLKYADLSMYRTKTEKRVLV